MLTKDINLESHNLEAKILKLHLNVKLLWKNIAHQLAEIIGFTF